MKEEIGPRLTKLKEEKIQYVEFQRVERELEHCKRICLAWRYVRALEESEGAEENVISVKNKIEDKRKVISIGKEELQNIEKEIEEITRKRDAVCTLNENMYCYIFHTFFHLFCLYRKQEVN